MSRARRRRNASRHRVSVSAEPRVTMRCLGAALLPLLGCSGCTTALLWMNPTVPAAEIDAAWVDADDSLRVCVARADSAAARVLAVPLRGWRDARHLDPTQRAELGPWLRFQQAESAVAEAPSTVEVRVVPPGTISATVRGACSAPFPPENADPECLLLETEPGAVWIADSRCPSAFLYARLDAPRSARVGTFARVVFTPVALLCDVVLFIPYVVVDQLAGTVAHAVEQTSIDR